MKDYKTGVLTGLILPIRFFRFWGYHPNNGESNGKEYGNQNGNWYLMGPSYCRLSKLWLVYGSLLSYDPYYAGCPSLKGQNLDNPPYPMLILHGSSRRVDAVHAKLSYHRGSVEKVLPRLGVSRNWGALDPEP